MRRIFVLTAMLAAGFVVSLQLQRAVAQTPPVPQTPPVAQTPPLTQAPPMPGADSLAATRDSLMNVVLKSIAGRESAPAESVFKNIRVLKGMPAGRVPRIMNIAFSQSLGVGCDHCHATTDWANDDKRPKQVARDMWGLMGTLNRELLPKIPNLESKQPGVNCTTCHRGEIKPAQNLRGK